MIKKHIHNPKDILQIIAEQLGVEEDDLTNEDSLKEDLHMTPQDLSELNERLVKHGFQQEKIDFNEIVSVGELIDKLVLEDEF